MVSHNPFTGLVHKVWIAGLILIVLTLLSGGYGYYRKEAEEIRQKRYEEISAIGRLKRDQILEWRKQRLADIGAFSKNPLVIAAVEQLIQDDASQTLRNGIKESLHATAAAHDYYNALLLDPEGKLLLSVNDEPDPVDPATRRAVETAASGREVVFSDFFRSPSGVIHIDAAAAVAGAGGLPLAVVVLRSNAQAYLYPLIQSWPTPSRSAETLLVQREGDGIVFLNELRHQAGTALSLRKPLALSPLPAAQAALGRQGRFEGKDYRGVGVMAELLPIPGSPWHMVAKVDAEEILSEARYRAGTITVIVGALVLVVVAVVTNHYQQRQAHLYKKLYEAERIHRENQEIFRTTLYSIGDAVVTTDTEGRVRTMNRVAETLTGWSEAQATGKPLRDVFRIIHEETRANVENPVERVIRDGRVKGLANHTLLIARDGTERPIADSGAPILGDTGVILGVVLVFRDQTEERRAERFILESEERLRLALSAADQGLYDLNVQTGDCVVNDEYARMLGYEPSEFIETNAAWRERLHPEDRDRVYRIYQDYVAGRRAEYRIEFRQRTKSGDWKWILSLGKLVEQTADGKPLRMLGTHTDITQRKLGEMALQESEDRYRALVEVTVEAMLVRDIEGRIVYANPAACFLLQASKVEDLVGRNYLDLVHPEDREGSAERVQRCLIENRAVPRREHRLITLEGLTVWVESTGFPIIYNKKTHVLGVYHDIASRKQAEEALRESERFLSSALDGLSSNIALLDEKGTILLVNRSWREFAEQNGILSADMVSEGVNYLQVCDNARGENSDQAGAFGKGIRAVLSGALKFFSLEYPCHSPDIQRWFVARVTSFPGPGPRRVVVAHDDITERVQAETALRESHERYRLVADYTYDWEFWTDPNERYAYVSPSCERVSGYPASFFIDNPRALFDITHPDDRKIMEAHGEETKARTPAMRELDFRIVTRTGETRWINHKCWAVYSQEGVFMGRRGSHRDITEQRLLENQFRQAQKMEAIGRLAGGVAHDFNNMLGVIMGFTELAILKLPADHSIQIHLEEVRLAAQRAAAITRQLLAFARKQTIAPVVLDLNETIEGVLKMLQRLIGEDIDLLWKPATNLWPVKVDPSQIDQILANLAVNARDAISGVGKITIETENIELDSRYCQAHAGFAPGSYVMLAVSDDGCGMSKETLERLFEPFYTTKEIGKGTGLGLSTVYGIVKQNNGFINVYSEPGQGSTFKVYLPRVESQSLEARRPIPIGEVPTGSETVLLVEDEAALLKFAGNLLEELGYTVIAADSPGKAIRRAGEFTADIHLLVTDIVMPEMNGRELMEKLQALRPRLKCLFMSGYTTNVIAHHGVLDEGIHFLQKPFTRELLARKVREALSS
jgi:PAS domain S-box-containing protein